MTCVPFVTEEPLEITKHLHNMEVTEGDVVDLVCEVSKVDAKATWKFNDKIITVKGGYDILASGKTHSLRLQDVELQDAGKYTVSIEEKESSADLRVLGNLWSPSNCLLFIFTVWLIVSLWCMWKKFIMYL